MISMETHLYDVQRTTSKRYHEHEQWQKYITQNHTPEERKNMIPGGQNNRSATGNTVKTQQGCIIITIDMKMQTAEFCLPQVTCSDQRRFAIKRYVRQKTDRQCEKSLVAAKPLGIKITTAARTSSTHTMIMGVATTLELVLERDR